MLEAERERLALRLRRGKGIEAAGLLLLRLRKEGVA